MNASLLQDLKDSPKVSVFFGRVCIFEFLSHLQEEVAENDELAKFREEWRQELMVKNKSEGNRLKQVNLTDLNKIKYMYQLYICTIDIKISHVMPCYKGACTWSCCPYRAINFTSSQNFSLHQHAISAFTDQLPWATRFLCTNAAAYVEMVVWNVTNLHCGSCSCNLSASTTVIIWKLTSWLKRLIWHA